MADYWGMDTETRIHAIRIAQAMIVATTAVVRDRLTDDQLERRQAFLSGPKPCHESR